MLLLVALVHSVCRILRQVTMWACSGVNLLATLCTRNVIVNANLPSLMLSSLVLFP